MGVGGALGLPFSAAVAENASWRVLFWVVAALASVVGVLVRLLVPAGRTESDAGRFDVPGAIGLGGALICLLLGVSTSGVGLAAAAVAFLIPVRPVAAADAADGTAAAPNLPSSAKV